MTEQHTRAHGIKDSARYYANNGFDWGVRDAILDGSPTGLIDWDEWIGDITIINLAYAIGTTEQKMLQAVLLACDEIELESVISQGGQLRQLRGFGPQGGAK